ncbi:hypothetical protein [Phocaeicola vulgatus]|jgi:hypothetical protein|uniref:Uncharacterized protein n=1 Tax=Phocaeicola vulgatus TaxID=821 RepID=A0AAE4L4V4_PHOVU|nr:hypothetical protein [Phocaeicola vulgatus]MCE8862754.1 hypothetical protein [Phocaeicola vulgatus]MDB1072276.1 hypothetical protein [Phocaeicola vulgatus]MDU0239105.1 hypothetical protein [Phocaeicola vulgatus]
MPLGVPLFFDMRYLFFFFFLAQSVFLTAQSHLTFMGIEISGHEDEFKKHLEQKGFEYLSSYEHSHAFFGKFANEYVNLLVLSSPKTNVVCKVIVQFPQKEKWYDLKRDYFNKKELYSSKYVLDKDFEFFSSPYEDGDGYEMRAIASEKCTYTTFFLAPNGGIILEIDKKKRIVVSYEDTLNTQLSKDELFEKAFDDI